MSYNPNGKGFGGVTISNADRATLEEILSLEPLPASAAPFQTEQFRGGGRAVNTYRGGRLIDGGGSSSGGFPNQEESAPGGLPADSDQSGAGIASKK
jgi:pilus assembly protein CpaB